MLRRVITVLELEFNRWDGRKLIVPAILLACPSRDGGEKWRVCRLFDRPHGSFASAVLDATMWAAREAIPIDLGAGEGGEVKDDYYPPQPAPISQPEPVTVPADDDDDDDREECESP